MVLARPLVGIDERRDRAARWLGTPATAVDARLSVSLAEGRLDRDAVGLLFTEAGIKDARVVAEPGEHTLAEPADFWRIVLGSGYRGTLEQLDAAARQRVQVATLQAMEGVRAITANILRGIAIKPALG